MAIKLKVQDNGPVRLNVAGTDGVRLTAEQGIPIYPNPYIGDYEVYPDETEHTLPTNGLMMTDDVTVHAVPSDYVGSAIDRRSADDVSVSGPSVSGLNGYYEELFTKTVQSGSAAVPSLNIEKNPTISVSTGGLITATVSTSETVSPIITEGYIDSGTSGTISFSGSSTQQLTVNTSGNLTASGNTVTAAPGFYAESASKSVSNGNIGVPYITKDAVSNHSVKLTPFYQRTQGWISGSGTYSGTQTTVSASDLVSGTLSITQNTTGQDVTNYQKVDVAVPGPVLETVTTSYTPSTSVQTDTITTSSGYDGIEQVNITVSAVTSGSAGTPTASKGTVTNHSVTVTPSVTNSTGYITGGTKTGTGVTVSASELVSGTLSINSAGTKDVTTYASATVATGGATASASKGTVSNHSITVTPMVTRTAGYVTAGTANGTSVTVSASELVSGTLSITANTTGQDVTNYQKVDVSVSGGAPNLQTKSVSYTPTTSQQTDTVTADAGYDGLDEVDVTIGAVSTGSVSTPATTITANPTITVNTANGLITATASSSKSVTPTVSTGWVSSGTSGTITVSGSNTSQLTTVNGTTITPTTSEQTAVSANRYTLGAVKVAAMPSGTAGTPSASKGTVTDHAIIVTPTVTNSTGYITGGTKTGTGVTVSASELVSGSETKTSNGTYDVTNLAQLIVNVSGGSGIGDLLSTTNIGAYSTSTTSSTNMNISTAATNINAYDLLLVETSVDTKVANRHMATVGAVFLLNSTNADTKNASAIATVKWNAKLSSSSVTQTTSSTSAYGIYPNSCTITTASNGTATFPMYSRYNSTRSGTINGNYKTRIYGVKLCDLIGG